MAAKYSGHRTLVPPVISPGMRNVPGGFFGTKLLRLSALVRMSLGCFSAGKWQLW